MSPTYQLKPASFLSLVIFQYVLLKVHRLILYPRFFSPLRHLPGPTDNPILVGQEIRKFTSSHPAGLPLEWMRKWPDAPFIRYLSFGGAEVLLTNSLLAHKAVLQTNCYEFVKPAFFQRLIGEITDTGLLFAVGDEHKKQRRLLTGPFSVPSVRKILPVFQSKARSLSSELDQSMGGQPYASVDVMPMITKSTIDMIAIAGLGIELGKDGAMTVNDFQNVYERLLEQPPLGQLVWVINSFVPIRSFLPLDANRSFINANQALRGLLKTAIRQRVEQLRGKSDKDVIAHEHRDLLSLMLQHAGSHTWTEDEILGHLLNFISAGHETTATGLTWAIYALATRHDVQERLSAEVTALLQKHEQPDYGELDSLPYLHNFIREVLRVYSPTLFAPREAARDLVIEGVSIPKGTTIDVWPWVMNMNPLVWGSDAEVFNPDRWVSLVGDASSPFAFETFIQGPRQCPGKNFAMIQLKALIFELVTRWQFLGVEKTGGSEKLLSDGEEQVGRGIKVQNPSPTYKPAGGLWIRFTKR